MNKNNFSRVSPPWRVSPGAVRPSPLPPPVVRPLRKTLFSQRRAWHSGDRCPDKLMPSCSRRCLWCPWTIQGRARRHRPLINSPQVNSPCDPASPSMTIVGYEMLDLVTLSSQICRPLRAEIVPSRSELWNHTPPLTRLMFESNRTKVVLCLIRIVSRTLTNFTILEIIMSLSYCLRCTVQFWTLQRYVAVLVG